MTRVTGHFGEWIQGRVGPDGSVALVTLRCPDLTVRVDAQGQSLFPSEVIETFFEALKLTPSQTRLKHDMPLGGGAGASTAGLIAMARVAGFQGTPEQLASACIQAEGASDPLMFDAPDQLIWASRRGEILGQTSALPDCEIVGGFWGQPVKTDPQNQAFPDVQDLLSAWADAVDGQDLPAMARLASQSVQRCDQMQGCESPLTDLTEPLGALGEVRAHTGSARGLIFAPGTVPPDAKSWLENLGLAGVLQFSTGGVT